MLNRKTWRFDMPIISQTKTPSDVADWSDCAELQRRMVLAVEALSAMAGDVGAAKTILEFSSDRRKRALGRACMAALLGGESAAKAELEARGSESYGKELTQLQAEHQAAEQAIAEWDCKRLEWDTARSLLAMMCESTKQL